MILFLKTNWSVVLSVLWLGLCLGGMMQGLLWIADCSLHVRGCF